MSSLSKSAIAVTGPAETGTDSVAGMPAGPSVASVTAPLRRWSRRGKPNIEEGAGVPLGILQAQEQVLDRLSMKWASQDFWRGFSDAVKTADFEVLRKIKMRLESARPVITRRGQIRRVTPTA